MTGLFDIDSLDCAELNGGRASIRPLGNFDGPTLFELSRSNHQYLSPWLSWAGRPTTKDDVVRFLAHCETAHQARLERHFALLLDDSVVGVLGCAPIDCRNRATTMGYWLDRSRWGQGIVSACVRRLAHVLLMSRDFVRIEVRCAAENSRGNRVAELCGFKREGQLRQAQMIGDAFLDLNIYSLVAGDLALPRSS
jgi:ribosomal-protein-serine acetyltransferase